MAYSMGAAAVKKELTDGGYDLTMRFGLAGPDRSVFGTSAPTMAAPAIAQAAAPAFKVGGA